MPPAAARTAVHQTACPAAGSRHGHGLVPARRRHRHERRAGEVPRERRDLSGPARRVEQTQYEPPAVKRAGPVVVQADGERAGPGRDQVPGQPRQLAVNEPFGGWPFTRRELRSDRRRLHRSRVGEEAGQHVQARLFGRGVDTDHPVLLVVTGPWSGTRSWCRRGGWQGHPGRHRAIREVRHAHPRRVLTGPRVATLATIGSLLRV
jgi:hypothetical protein